MISFIDSADYLACMLVTELLKRNRISRAVVHKYTSLRGIFRKDQADVMSTLDACVRTRIVLIRSVVTALVRDVEPYTSQLRPCSLLRAVIHLEMSRDDEAIGDANLAPADGSGNLLVDHAGGAENQDPWPTNFMDECNISRPVAMVASKIRGLLGLIHVGQKMSEVNISISSDILVGELTHEAVVEQLTTIHSATRLAQTLLLAADLVGDDFILKRASV